MHLAIAGNIGSGKTTLTRMLAEHSRWKPIYEPVSNNPYLEDYYHDFHRWAFNMEIFFLKERFRSLLEITQSDQHIVQDRTIFEGVYIFAANNKAMGNLSDTDYQTYMDLFKSMMMVAKYPDLLVYLKASLPHLAGNIQKRGRGYEQKIPLEYLQNLNERYDNFIYNKYKGRKLIINVDDLNFADNPKAFMEINDKIDASLFGLFSQPEKQV